MGESRRQYDQEFKRNAFELCHTSGKTTSQIARDLGINSSMLSRWQREQAKYGEREEKAPEPGAEMELTYYEDGYGRLVLTEVKFK